jgi:superfamily II RNA helicase
MRPSGLSATVGSPEAFNEWLHSVQTEHGFNHTFVTHPHRYSHLRKFYYAPQYKPKMPFSGLDTYESTERTLFLHPISMLSFGPRSLPPDLALEASDTLQLYMALVSHKDKIRDDLSTLEPTKFFPDHSLLSQKDIIRYEDALKAIVLKLVNQDATSALSAIIQDLEDRKLGQIRHLLEITPSKLSFRSNLIHLISDLHVGDNLVSPSFQS